MILDASRSKKRNGNWVHFQCPVCPARGYGADRGQHLGVNIVNGSVHCWRCGADKLPAGWSVKGRHARVEVREVRAMKAAGEYPRLNPQTIPSPWKRTRGIPVDTSRGPAHLLTFADSDAYQLRYLDGKQPKTRSFGVSGPLFVHRPSRHAGRNCAVVVGEGWADAEAAERGEAVYQDVLALNGVDNWRRAMPIIEEYPGVFLALDNDGPGRRTRDSMTRRLLQRHIPVFWGLYTGKDPAEFEEWKGWVSIRSIADMRGFDADQTAEAK